MKHREGFSLRKTVETIVPPAVLTWALAVLTMSYIGLAKIDAAFISSLVTSVLAVYGVKRTQEEKTPPPGVSPAPRSAPAPRAPKQAASPPPVQPPKP